MEEEQLDINQEEKDDKKSKKQEEQNNNGAKRKRGLWGKLFGSSLRDNIKGAFKGNLKDKLAVKIKLVAILAVAIILVFIIIIEGLEAEEPSENTTSSIKKIYYATASNTNKSEAEISATNEFEKSGSLILSTDEQLEAIANEFYDSIKNNLQYVEAFNVKYSGNSSNTVANKINHITSGKQNTELSPTAGSVINIANAASLSDERTIYEHILRTEKYNFNNIIWRSFEKSGNGVKQAEVTLRVDNDTKLKYPVEDSADTEGSIHDLSYFVSKVRPYLQSYYIPLDMMLGTRGGLATDAGNYNTKFAYEILASAYHEIVLDRYKVETLTRNTNYVVYDKTETTTTVTRTCADYDLGGTTEVVKEKGEACDKEDYLAGRCEDYVMSVKVSCTRYDYNNNRNGCKDTGSNKVTEYKVNCEDRWASGCSYGKLKEDVTVVQDNIVTMCVDTTNEPTTQVQKDIRETISTNDSLKYRWDYVVSTAKMFDTVISNEYTLSPYTKYSLNNYNSYIGKSGNYATMTIENFASAEKTNSNADVYTHTPETYYVKASKPVTNNTSWNSQYVVSTIPSEAVKVGSVSSQVVSSTIEIVKEGTEYSDTYVWNDKLKFGETKTGTYNLDSVKDVVGDVLSGEESQKYSSTDINLIDIMNASKDRYSNYMTLSYSENMGYLKTYLQSSYDILKDDLVENAKEHNLVSLAYGSSLGIEINSFGALSGLNISGVSNISAGSFNGLNVSYPLASEDIKDAWLWLTLADSRSYGYIGHMGVDISYSQSLADTSLCKDTSASRCAYIRGPEIYSMYDGVIEKVVYSAYNNKYSTGQYVGNSKDGDLTISDTSGYGSYVIIKNVDGSYTLYGHLFPDRDYFKDLASKVGQPVTAGTFIGYMGNTGSSDALHLHIEFTRSMSSIGRVANSLLTGEYIKNVIKALGITPVYH